MNAAAIKCMAAYAAKEYDSVSNNGGPLQTPAFEWMFDQIEAAFALNARTLVIFGGPDAEEATARALARGVGCATATATLTDKPVHAGNAYQAAGYRLDDGEVTSETKCIIFECAPAAAGALEVVARCDHHNPGDPGWGMDASQYWEASSLGQLHEFLWGRCGHSAHLAQWTGGKPTPEMKLVAAGDHSPAGAYLGQCPGIDPATFAAWRIEGKVAFYAINPKTAHKADAEKIHAAINAATEILHAAPLVDGVRDLRAAGHIDELPEAALSCGEAYMAALPETDRSGAVTGNMKIVLGGHASPEKVRFFMEWANSLPLKVGPAYGNPDRGFAGVVVKLK